MILYTYQSEYDIFPVDESIYGEQEMVSIPGGQLIVAKDSDNNAYRIVQLLSTDPNMFLDARYTPGQLLK